MFDFWVLGGHLCPVFNLVCGVGPHRLGDEFFCLVFFPYFTSHFLWDVQIDLSYLSALRDGTSRSLVILA